MSISGFQEDVDELLAALTPEELQELERELDDTVAPGLRQRDQTTRTPTGDQTTRTPTGDQTTRTPRGDYDQAALLRFWEDENRKLLEDERTERRPDGGRGEPGPDAGGEAPHAATKKSSQRGKKVKESEKEKKDECKEAAGTRSQGPQKKSPPGESRRTGTTAGNPEATAAATAGNPTAVAETLERIRLDDPAVSEVNLNNLEDITQETLLRFADALRNNTHVRVFSLANTRADDRVALAVSEMLRENRSVRSLNVESNFLSGRGVLALLAALRHNRALAELRFHNQRHVCGGKAEMEMVQLLRENTTLLKLGYQFDLPGPRMAATGILTRNQDRKRQRRLRQKEERERGPPAPAGREPGSPKETSPSPKTVETQKGNPPPAPPPPASLAPPTRKISAMVERREGVATATKTPSDRRETESKTLKNGADEKESAETLGNPKNGLKPATPRVASRDDLMAAIRESNVGSLRR
ncbi:Leiomodin-2 [Liparis tanakae]|uniref:Leiomodin-3 n=1 Tax=Liparis tanakae TaxID=230148 RepID=A0A4Z2GFV8_9TELE|nr:Leiomodin-2 [Liparis tanakae]